MFRRPRLRFWALLTLSLLAACGSDAGPAALAPSQSSAATAPQVAAPPTAATQPTAATSTDQTATPAAARDIPESVTAEGYHVLGRADAPVTLTMYSDFL